jgi:hypothetical protein
MNRTRGIILQKSQFGADFTAFPGVIPDTGKLMGRLFTVSSQR